MKIHNENWFPLVKKYSDLAKVSNIAMVYEEDVDVAGMFDPENDSIVINIAPNVLAEVAINYNLRSSELAKIAACVFLEECVHSQGIDDEEQAKVMARMLVENIPADELEHKGGMAAYAERQFLEEATS